MIRRSCAGCGRTVHDRNEKTLPRLNERPYELILNY